MPGKPQRFLEPLSWNEDRLDQDRRAAIEHFRERRRREPLQEYLERFDAARISFERLMNETVDLTALSERAVEILTDQDLLAATRYLAGPPISDHDLQTQADTTFAKKKLHADPALARRIVETVLLRLDPRRFPWLSKDEIRRATDVERASAVLASAALMASQTSATKRRNAGKSEQEERVRRSLTASGMTEVPARTASRLEDAPKPGAFCRESSLGTRKADLIVGLWDGRTMAIECKVSNSSTNSIKRLNNDAAVKAKSWIAELGHLNVVPVAVLSGVFKLRNLVSAQDNGLMIVWSHDLAALTEWILATRPPN